MLARKTLAAIEAAMQKDGGAAFRQLQAQTLPQCEDAYRGAESPYRSHLGASVMGRPCARELWYLFHWTATEQVKASVLRLWNRGHLEEGRMVALLRMIGVDVYQHTPDGKQQRITDHTGHYGGSLDGELEGVPDIPNERVLGEFKTHGQKSYDKLVAEGLHDSKFDHYIQMQQYMRKRGLRWGLYLATNKNTDELYAEIIELNPALADRYLQRAAMIIWAEEPPPRISNSPAWWQCRFCTFRPQCHYGAPVARNCRTCAHSSTVLGGWRCALAPAGVLTPREVQEVGCKQYKGAPWTSGHTS